MAHLNHSHTLARIPRLKTLIFLVTLTLLSQILIVAVIQIRNVNHISLIVSRVGKRQEIAGSKRVAVFVQGFGLHNIAIYQDVMTCIKNVAEAKSLADNFKSYPWVDVEPPPSFTFDVFISHREASELSDEEIDADMLAAVDIAKLSSQLLSLGADEVIGFPITVNQGYDIKQFMDQLQYVESNPELRYDSFLKIHTKSKEQWRHIVLDSLCGSPGNVITAIRSLNRGKIGMIAPQGFVVQSNHSVTGYSRALRKEFSRIDMQLIKSGHRHMMWDIWKEMYGTDLDTTADFAFAAGTMFWSKYEEFCVKDWVRILPWLSSKWSVRYQKDAQIEHAIERMFGTIPFLKGVTIAEIPVSAKPIGIYLPNFYNSEQYHNIDEWSLLKSISNGTVAKPLSPTKGGLGFYDITQIGTRKKQGEMAKAAGLHGFMYYHNWSASKAHFGKVPELMLEDGHPDLPFSFMFCWDNAPMPDKWVRLRGGKSYSSSEYGDEAEWRAHFEYLLPFFEHPNYILVEGKPIFVIKHADPSHTKPILELWTLLARQSGLLGIHFVFALSDGESIQNALTNDIYEDYSGLLHFYPSVEENLEAHNISSSSRFDFNFKLKQGQFWGAHCSFNDSLLRPSDPYCSAMSPERFRAEFRASLVEMRTRLPLSRVGRILTPNLYFVTAWNDWNEQSVLEPSDMHGFSYLSAIKSNIENQPLVEDRMAFQKKYVSPYFGTLERAG